MVIRYHYNSTIHTRLHTFNTDSSYRLYQVLFIPVLSQTLGITESLFPHLHYHFESRNYPSFQIKIGEIEIAYCIYLKIFIVVVEYDTTHSNDTTINLKVKTNQSEVGNKSNELMKKKTYTKEQKC